MDKTSYIYGLQDPLTEEIRYVGASINPENRMSCHMSLSINVVKSRWLGGLKNRGLRPNIVILEEVATAARKEAEAKWIRFFQDSGVAITNAIYPGYSRLKLNALCQEDRWDRRKRS